MYSTISAWGGVKEHTRRNIATESVKQMDSLTESTSKALACFTTHSIAVERGATSTHMSPEWIFSEH